VRWDRPRAPWRLPSAPRRHSLILQKDGWILREEFLEPLGIAQYRLAKEIGVPQARIGEIVAGRYRNNSSWPFSRSRNRW
jgi:hypothetical protein